MERIEEWEKYLKPTPIIDCDHRTIQEKANEVTKGQEGVIEKSRSLFAFVRDGIKYNPYLPRYLLEHFRASNTLARGEGFCVQKAMLLVALSRVAEIPASPIARKNRNGNSMKVFQTAAIGITTSATSMSAAEYTMAASPPAIK